MPVDVATAMTLVGQLRNMGAHGCADDLFEWLKEAVANAG